MHSYVCLWFISSETGPSWCHTGLNISPWSDLFLPPTRATQNALIWCPFLSIQRHEPRGGHSYSIHHRPRVIRVRSHRSGHSCSDSSCPWSCPTQQNKLQQLKRKKVKEDTEIPKTWSPETTQRWLLTGQIKKLQNFYSSKWKYENQ